jgi:hypothetical protein
MGLYILNGNLLNGLQFRVASDLLFRDVQEAENVAADMHLHLISNPLALASIS